MAQRYRLSTTEKLSTGKRLLLQGNPAHYLANVLRLKVGDAVSVFSRAEGEFEARIAQTNKREVMLEVLANTRPPERGTGLTVCFVPIKGGRLETIIEKATELGADVLQPVFSARSVVDKFNPERAELIARESAEQCERVSWPEIREPVKLLNLLGDWPRDMPLIYGDETGGGVPIGMFLESPHPDFLRFAEEATLGNPTSPVNGRGDQAAPLAYPSELGGEASPLSRSRERDARLSSPHSSWGGLSRSWVRGSNAERHWAILAGPEGGFTPEEFVALKKVSSAKGVSLGPRILRADTAIITLAAATLMAWGDWDQSPRAPSLRDL